MPVTVTTTAPTAQDTPIAPQAQAQTHAQPTRKRPQPPSTRRPQTSSPNGQSPSTSGTAPERPTVQGTRTSLDQTNDLPSSGPSNNRTTNSTPSRKQRPPSTGTSLRPRCPVVGGLVVPLQAGQSSPSDTTAATTTTSPFGQVSSGFFPSPAVRTTTAAANTDTSASINTPQTQPRRNLPARCVPIFRKPLIRPYKAL